MKFEKIVLELEKYESLDIIAASTGGEEPTEGTTIATQNTDPFEADKW